MNLTKSILQDVRESVGLTSETSDFDTELLMHINVAIGKVNQVGVGNFIVVENESSVWQDLLNPEQVTGNKYFKMIPLFVTLSTKLLFDPPPPSSAEYHSSACDQILWRLKIAYEEPTERGEVSEGA